MIGYLRGSLVAIRTDAVLLDVNGVGYRVQMPISQLEGLPKAGEEFVVYTHLIQRDDSISLYGFIDERGLDIFRMLLEVSGVGPRLALNILSVVPVDELIQSISRADPARLQSVHGVGKKTAARICVDLKEKAAKYISEIGLMPERESGQQAGTDMDTKMVEDAVSALSNLGYKPAEAKRAVMHVMTGLGRGDINQVIKSALQVLSNIVKK